MITISAGATTITLPEDLVWPGEFDWSAVEQSVEYSCAGAVVVQEGVKQKGREITLQGSEDAAWITRAVLEQLYTMSQVAGQVFTLSFHGREFDVMFLRPKGIEATQVVGMSDPASSDYYWIKLNFIEVA